MQPSVTVGFGQSFVLYHQGKKREKKSRVKDIKYDAVINPLVLTTVRITAIITANLDKPEKIIHLSEYEQAWDISLGEN